MNTRLVPGQLLALRAPSEVARQAAARIVRAIEDAIDARGRATVALSGGSTPRDAYRQMAAAPGVDWPRVDVFWVDERAGDPSGDRSNYRWAKSTLLDAVAIPAQNVHRMPADRADLDVAAREYELLLSKNVGADVRGLPAFDAVVLGVGDDGHTASLFPHDDALAVLDRRVVSVPPKATREARLTLTSPVLQAGRCVFVLAVGESKRRALERVWDVDGSVDETPARVLRECRGVLTWIVDRAAAGLTE